MILIEPVADEYLPLLIAIAAGEFPELPVDVEAVLAVHRWSKSIFAVKAAGNLIGGVAALFLNAAGKEAMIGETLPLGRPPLHLLASPGEDVAAAYVWMLIARENGNAAWQGFRRIVAALPGGPDIYGRPANAGAVVIFRSYGGAPHCEGSGLWMHPA